MLVKSNLALILIATCDGKPNKKNNTITSRIVKQRNLGDRFERFNPDCTQANVGQKIDEPKEPEDQFDSPDYDDPNEPKDMHICLLDKNGQGYSIDEHDWVDPGTPEGRKGEKIVVGKRYIALPSKYPNQTHKEWNTDHQYKFGQHEDTDKNCTVGQTQQDGNDVKICLHNEKLKTNYWLDVEDYVDPNSAEYTQGFKIINGRRHIIVNGELGLEWDTDKGQPAAVLGSGGSAGGSVGSGGSSQNYLEEGDGEFVANCVLNTERPKPFPDHDEKNEKQICLKHKNGKYYYTDLEDYVRPGSEDKNKGYRIRKRRNGTEKKQLVVQTRWGHEEWDTDESYRGNSGANVQPTSPKNETPGVAQPTSADGAEKSPELNNSKSNIISISSNLLFLF